MSLRTRQAGIRDAGRSRGGRRSISCTYGKVWVTAFRIAVSLAVIRGGSAGESRFSGEIAVTVGNRGVFRRFSRESENSPGSPPVGSIYQVGDAV